MKAPLIIHDISKRVGNEAREPSWNYSHETSSQEDDGVDQSHNPLIALVTLTSDSKLLWEAQVGAVGARLIPALCCSSNGTQRYRIPEHRRPMPLVIALVCQGIDLILVESVDRGEAGRIACNEGCLAKQSRLVLQPVFLCKLSSSCDNLFRRVSL